MYDKSEMKRKALEDLKSHLDYMMGDDLRPKEEEPAEDPQIKSAHPDAMEGADPEMNSRCSYEGSDDDDDGDMDEEDMKALIAHYSK